MSTVIRPSFRNLFALIVFALAVPGIAIAKKDEIAALAATLQDTAAYRQGGAGAAAQARLAAAQAELDAAYARWAALE